MLYRFSISTGDNHYPDDLGEEYPDLNVACSAALEKMRIIFLMQPRPSVKKFAACLMIIEGEKGERVEIPFVEALSPQGEIGCLHDTLGHG